MKKLITKEQIDALDLEGCSQHLARIENDPMINRSLIKHPELLEIADDWANVICWLEERRQQLRQIEILSDANAARWSKYKDKQNEEN